MTNTRTCFFNNQLRRIKEHTVSYMELVLINKVFLRHNRTFSWQKAYTRHLKHFVCVCMRKQIKKRKKKYRRKSKWVKQIVLTQTCNAAIYFSVTLCNALKHKYQAKKAWQFCITSHKKIGLLFNQDMNLSTLTTNITLQIYILYYTEARGKLPSILFSTLLI